MNCKYCQKKIWFWQDKSNDKMYHSVCKKIKLKEDKAAEERVRKAEEERARKEAEERAKREAQIRLEKDARIAREKKEAEEIVRKAKEDQGRRLAEERIRKAEEERQKLIVKAMEESKARREAEEKRKAEEEAKKPIGFKAKELFVKEIVPYIICKKTKQVGYNIYDINFDYNRENTNYANDLQLAIEYKREGKFEEAVKQFVHIYNTYPRVGLGMYRCMWKCLLSAGLISEAILVLEGEILYMFGNISNSQQNCDMEKSSDKNARYNYIIASPIPALLNNLPNKTSFIYDFLDDIDTLKNIFNSLNNKNNLIDIIGRFSGYTCYVEPKDIIVS